MSGVKESNLNKYLVQTSVNYEPAHVLDRDPSTLKENLKKAYEEYKKKALLRNSPVKSYHDWIFSDMYDKDHDERRNRKHFEQSSRKNFPKELLSTRNSDPQKSAKQEIYNARRAKYTVVDNLCHY